MTDQERDFKDRILEIDSLAKEKGWFEGGNYRAIALEMLDEIDRLNAQIKRLLDDGFSTTMFDLEKKNEALEQRVGELEESLHYYKQLLRQLQKEEI